MTSQKTNKTDSAEVGRRATVVDCIRSGAEAFEQAQLHYGHGTENAPDEARVLVFHVLGWSFDVDLARYDEPVSESQHQRIRKLFEQRIKERVPAPYLTKEAWFAGHRFFVDERVLIPRSPIAEMILNEFQPWVRPGAVKRVLELGTGSGALAIATALQFPDAHVDAVDIDTDALAVAAINIKRFGLENRVHLIRSSWCDSLPTDAQYDLVLSNPPYVPPSSYQALPGEFGHEPKQAFVAGDDGLDAVRIMLEQLPEFLSKEAVFVLEVGESAEQLQRAFPKLPWVWVDLVNGGDGVAVLSANGWLL